MVTREEDPFRACTAAPTNCSLHECPNGSARPEVDCSYVAEISRLGNGQLSLAVGTCCRAVDDVFISVG